MSIGFSEVTVITANLGGQSLGDSADEEIYYQNVGTYGSQRVNLRLTTQDTYQCKSGWGCSGVKVHDNFGQVGMSGSSNNTPF